MTHGLGAGAALLLGLIQGLTEFLPISSSAHIRIVSELLTGHDELLRDMLSAHLAQVSVRQNEDTRKISAWAAMIAVPTLIVGIYGMNFHHMPELTWTFGYPLALAVMAGICWWLYRAFRKSGWL